MTDAMAGLTLITISLLVNVLAIFKSVIASYPYLESGFGGGTHHGSVVYVPVCTPDCFKRTPCDFQNSYSSSRLGNTQHHQESQRVYSGASNSLYSSSLGQIQSSGFGTNHGSHSSYTADASKSQFASSGVQESTSVHQQTVHHHGSGISHQKLKQVHQDDHDDYEEHEHDHKKSKNANYQFEYSVQDHKTGDIKLHKETRNGDEVTGEYSLLEEDGNVRTVKYFADWKSGFHAKVHNSNPKS